MNNNISAKDSILKIAKKRVRFKQHVIIFFLFNLFIWVVYFFIFKGKHSGDATFLKAILFILILWSIVLVGHYFFAMKWTKKMLEREVKELLKEVEQ